MSMDAVGDFSLWSLMDFLDTDEDDTILSSLDLTTLEPMASTTANYVDMENALHATDEYDLEAMPTVHSAACKPIQSSSAEGIMQTSKHPSVSKKRFKSVSEKDLTTFESSHQSKSTKLNTRWGIKLFQEWHMEIFDTAANLESIPVEDLADLMRKFYCEARPKESKSREQNLPSNLATVYHKNTLKNVRAAINRHLQDIGRVIDIVRDKEFKAANRTLDGMLKEMTRAGASRGTKHKAVIDTADIKKISDYFVEHSESSPITLRQCVWYNISLHFVTRGLECHHQLLQESFEFHTDENEIEFVTIAHETQQKNFQGGLNKEEAPSDRRMYATGQNSCPVKMLKLLIEKTDPSAKALFNACDKDALTKPNLLYWYSSKPLVKRTFANFMADICKAASCNKKYTAHCLRATAIQFMSDAGFQARHIMFMSGHRSEASLRSYSRNMSTEQKKSISSTLSAVATGSEPCVDIPVTNNQLVPVSVGHMQLSQTSSQQQSNVPSASTSIMSSVHASTGFLTNSTFHGCTFNFSGKM